MQLAAFVHRRVLLPGAERVGHAQVVTAALGGHGLGHGRVHPLLGVVHAGRGGDGQPGLPFGFGDQAPPGRDAGGGQMQQWELEPALVDRGRRQALLGGEQHVVPVTGQVLGHGQVEVGPQAEAGGRAPVDHRDADGQIAQGRAQVAGQQPQHATVGQRVDVGRVDLRGVGLQVGQLGQAVAWAEGLGRGRRDQGPGPGRRALIQHTGGQGLPPQGHAPFPVADQDPDRGQPVSGHRGYRPAARVGSGLGQRLREVRLRLGELAGR